MPGITTDAPLRTTTLGRQQMLVPSSSGTKESCACQLFCSHPVVSAELGELQRKRGIVDARRQLDDVNVSSLSVTILSLQAFLFHCQYLSV